MKYYLLITLGILTWLLIVRLVFPNMFDTVLGGTVGLLLVNTFGYWRYRKAGHK